LNSSCVFKIQTIRALNSVIEITNFYFYFSKPAERSQICIMIASCVVCCSEDGKSKTAYVTFKDPKALEIALLLSVMPLFLL